MNLKRPSWILSLTVAFLVAATWVEASPAETVYVSNLSITVRRGPGIDYKIIAFLKTGTEVEHLETKDGWAQIAFKNGRQGYVLSRYLTSRPPLAKRIESLLADQAQMQQAIEQLEADNRNLQEGLKSPVVPIQTSGAKPIIRRVSGDDLKKALIIAHRLLKEEETTASRLREQLRDDEDLWQWFMIGSGVSAMGIVLGFLTYRSRRSFLPKVG